MVDGKLQLKSGQSFKIRSPPLTQEFMEHMQKVTIEAALENPKEYRKLTREQVAEEALIRLPLTWQRNRYSRNCKRRSSNPQAAVQ